MLMGAEEQQLAELQKLTPEQIQNLIAKAKNVAGMLMGAEE